MDKFIKWCGSSSTGAKVTRTIAQGVVSLALVMVPTWAGAHLPDEVMACMVPPVMACLAAAQAWIGSKGTYPINDAGGTD